MQKEVTLDQLKEMTTLQPGDTFAFRGRQGEEKATFVKLNRTKIVGVMNGNQYVIPMTLFLRVESRAAIIPTEEKTIAMKQGDLFYIEQNGKALLFGFVKFEGGRIIGQSVLHGGRVRIDKSLFAGTVNDLLDKRSA